MPAENRNDIDITVAFGQINARPIPKIIFPRVAVKPIKVNIKKYCHPRRVSEYTTETMEINAARLMITKPKELE